MISRRLFPNLIWLLSLRRYDLRISLSFYDTSAAAVARSAPFDLKIYSFTLERTLVIKCVADTIGPSVGNGITHVTIPSTL